MKLTITVEIPIKESVLTAGSTGKLVDSSEFMDRVKMGDTNFSPEELEKEQYEAICNDIASTLENEWTIYEYDVNWVLNN